MFIKFEYLKFSGCLQDIRVFENFSDNVQVIMKIDDVLIPNFRMPTRIYEELESGSRYEFYGLVQKSRDKQKNKGFVMAVKAEDGKVLEQSSLKYTSQLGIWANGAVIAGVAFLLSWIVLFFTIGLFDKSGGSYSGFARIVSDLTHYSLTIAGLVFAGFVGIGINLFRKAVSLETWHSITPANLVQRFSKMHR